MNVVMLTDSASVTGGASKIAFDGARALAMAGNQVHLVCGIGPVMQDLKDKPGLEVHCLGYCDIHEDSNRLRAMARGWWRPAAGRYVGELLDTLDPKDTIVHVHSWTRALSSSVIRAAMEREFPTVFTLHDFVLACPTGTLFLQKTQQKCTLRPMSTTCICTNCDTRSYGHKMWRVGRHLVQDSFGLTPSGARHFIVYSQTAKDLLLPYLPKEAKFYSVPNAIEMSLGEPADVCANETFMFLGRLTPEKGPEMFARAALAEGAPCLFIGDGLSRGAIARANPQAVFSKWMSHSEALKTLRQARALVFPSLWYETLGLVVLEAAGSGVPSIVPDTCAAHESVIDGVTGLYFRSGDEGDLRAKIAVLKDPVVAARMGKAAYEKFWAFPGSSLELHRHRLVSAYREILASR